MGKKEKEHRKKVTKRNEKIKKETEKYLEQRRRLMETIQLEKENGSFENNPEVNFENLINQPNLTINNQPNLILNGPKI
jgi:wobble nucleotide-excising tRNase